ncbi:GNAT family N-acetyltransferase [Amycolatopsis minnesotensis]|uniref:N-acetyltransferase domain-containing protein n=1 Tax=Amycolatopsis minnesotensis TaxID=337894 RepID=A0ABN2RR31_9PSEU
MAEIRAFAEADRTELRALFGYAGDGSPTASLWGHEESEAAIYLHPYLDLDAGAAFVAVADGALVGYLVGCADGSVFPSERARINDAIRKYRLSFRRQPAAFFARSLLDLAWAALRRLPVAGELDDPRWPAHLHINVAPAARGTGAAEGLVRRWLAVLGETGCHLQTLRENTRAVRFFERMGFVQHGPDPLVPGIRYHGARVHQHTMVRTP